MKLLKFNIQYLNNAIANSIALIFIRNKADQLLLIRKGLNNHIRNFKSMIYLDKVKYFFLFFSILLIENCALGDDVFATKFCSLTSIVKGPIGMGICVITLIGLFLSVLFGRIDFRTFILTALGIISIFYAQEVVSFITQNPSYSNCNQIS